MIHYDNSISFYKPEYDLHVLSGYHFFQLARSSIGGQSLVADSLEPQLLKSTVEKRG